MVDAERLPQELAERVSFQQEESDNVDTLPDKVGKPNNLGKKRIFRPWSKKRPEATVTASLPCSPEHIATDDDETNSTIHQPIRSPSCPDRIITTTSDNKSADPPQFPSIARHSSESAVQPRTTIAANKKKPALKTQPRIPLELQAVFLQSNREGVVDSPPPKNLACKVFGKWRPKKEKQQQQKKTKQERKLLFGANETFIFFKNKDSSKSPTRRRCTKQQDRWNEQQQQQTQNKKSSSSSSLTMPKRPGRRG